MGLRELLDQTRGVSEHIIAVFVDIRGFSSFSQTQDSVDVGVFISQAFKKLIDEYFPFATFYKSTGDGLLLIVPYSDAQSLQTNAQLVVGAAVRAVAEFPQICEGNPLVNFACPEKIGFGIARGAACCLLSGEEIVDYSGHRLNLAARLMDIARPRGIILDGDFGIELLDDDTKKLFEPDQVYIRSLAESVPHKIFYEVSNVELSENTKRPLHTESWKTEDISPNGSKTATLKDWEFLMPSAWKHDLDSKLKRSDAIIVTARIPMKKSGKVAENLWSHMTLFSPEDYNYVESGNDAYVLLNAQRFVDYARDRKLPKASPIRVTIRYVGT